jgi:hypothetical protein
MQDLNRDGRIRAIGVADFYPDRLIDLIDHNEVSGFDATNLDGDVVVVCSPNLAHMY